MVTDFSTLEKLYRRGVLDINGKDYINGGNSNVTILSERETFLPDNRFSKIDGNYIRQQIDKDTFNYSSSNPYQENYNWNNNGFENTATTQSKKEIFTKKAKEFLFNDITAGVIGIGALLLSGRYILKKLHILK